MDFVDFLYAECEMKEKQRRKKIPMSVIEDIKAEISHKMKLCKENKSQSYGMELALAIIDKHISGKEQE